MDPFDEFLESQRRLAPPPSHTREIERYVLKRITSPVFRRIRLSWAVAVVGLCAVLLLALLLRKADRESSIRQPDFVESVVFLDGHTCIWLDPVIVTSRRVP